MTFDSAPCRLAGITHCVWVSLVIPGGVRTRVILAVHEEMQWSRRGAAVLVDGCLGL